MSYQEELQGRILILWVSSGADQHVKLVEQAYSRAVQTMLLFPELDRQNRVMC